MIEIDPSALTKAEAMLKDIPGAAQKAAKTAIKKTMKGAQQAAIKKVRERYTIKPAYIKPTITTISGENGMIAGFKSRGRVNDLSYFKHTPASVPKKRPEAGKYLFSQVIKGEGGTIAHAFLARMSSGHVGVFQRMGHGASNESLPIEKMAGPSTPQMLGSPTVSDFVQQNMEERLDVNIDHEINAFLMGYRR